MDVYLKITSPNDLYASSRRLKLLK